MNKKIIHSGRPDDEEGLTIKTKGNVPDQPLTPRVHERQDLLELWWGPWGSTSTNSHAVLRYVLEMRDVEEGDLIRNSNETEGAVITKSSTTITQSAWKPIYNGTGKAREPIYNSIDSFTIFEMW